MLPSVALPKSVKSAGNKHKVVVELVRQPERAKVVLYRPDCRFAKF